MDYRHQQTVLGRDLYITVDGQFLGLLEFLRRIRSVLDFILRIINLYRELEAFWTFEDCSKGRV